MPMAYNFFLKIRPSPLQNPGSAYDTRLYFGVGHVTDCDNLQLDLNTVYDWASSNSMF